MRIQNFIRWIFNLKENLIIQNSKRLYNIFIYNLLIIYHYIIDFLLNYYSSGLLIFITHLLHFFIMNNTIVSNF